MSGEAREVADTAAAAPRGWRDRRFGRVAAVLGAVVVLAGIIYSLAGTLGTTDGNRPGGGEDTHATFGAGMSAIVQTDDKAVVQVVIRSVADEGFGFTATVAGLREGTTGTWTAILDNGRELPLTASRDGDDITVILEGEIPAANTIQAVSLDPDSSSGDIIFELD